MRLVGLATGLIVLVVTGIYWHREPIKDETTLTRVIVESELKTGSPEFRSHGGQALVKEDRHGGNWRETPGIWSLAVAEYASEPPMIRADVQNARLAGFDRAKISLLRKGDVMTLPIPQSGRSYVISVTGVKTTKSGNKVIKGSIDGSPNSALFTLGPSSLFATVGTPEGIFNVHGNDSLAWIVEAKELNHHVDPSYPDYVSSNIANER